MGIGDWRLAIGDQSTVVPDPDAEASIRKSPIADPSIFNLQSPISNLQSSISNLQSPIFSLQSSVFNLQSSASVCGITTSLRTAHRRNLRRKKESDHRSLPRRRRSGSAA